MSGGEGVGVMVRVSGTYVGSREFSKWLYTKLLSLS